MLDKLTDCLSSLSDTITNTVKGSYHALFGVASPHSMSARFDTTNFIFDSIQICNVVGGYEVHLLKSANAVHTFTLATTGTLSYWQLTPEGMLILELDVK